MTYCIAVDKEEEEEEENMLSLFVSQLPIGKGFIMTEQFDQKLVEALRGGEVLRIPAVATKPPQESLRDFLPKYITLAKANNISSLHIEVGQLTFTYDVQSGKMTTFDISAFSKENGVNVDLMKKETQKVLDSLI